MPQAARAAAVGTALHRCRQGCSGPSSPAAAPDLQEGLLYRRLGGVAEVQLCSNSTPS